MLLENNPALTDYQQEWVAERRTKPQVSLRVWAFLFIIYAVQLVAGAYLWSEPLHYELSLFMARLGAFAVVLAVLLRFFATTLYIPLFILAFTCGLAATNKELKEKIVPQISVLLNVFNPKRNFRGAFFLVVGYLLDWFVFIGLIVGNHPWWAGLFLLAALINQVIRFVSKEYLLTFLKSLQPESEELVTQ